MPSKAAAIMTDDFLVYVTTLESMLTFGKVTNACVCDHMWVKTVLRVRVQGADLLYNMSTLEISTVVL